MSHIKTHIDKNSIDILLLTSKLSPAAGGMAVSVPSLAFSLDCFPDLNMHVVGTSDPDYVNSSQCWGPSVKALKVRGPKALQFAPSMGKVVSKLSPSIIDVQGLWTYSSLLSLRYSRRTDTPYVITPRGMLDPWARQNSRWKKKLVSLAYEDAHLKGAHLLRATAEMEAQHFRDIGLTNPIAIVPNGIDLPPLAKRTQSNMRSILFLSRIHPKKGVDYLLKAWQSMHNRFPDWEIIIAGIDENNYESELKSLVMKLKLPRVRFIGEVHGVAKQELYRNADLFVLPTHAENFGLVVAEALAQETPVITTKNAPWSGLKDNACGWWIDLEQVTLNNTLYYALSLPATELSMMGVRGRKWVGEVYTVDKVAEKMHTVYNWLAKKEGKPECVYE